MTPAEYEVLLHDAEVKLARLKALYEQYFQGIEKLEPQVARKDLDRAMELLRKNQPRNTALRFRTQMLMAKYGTYQTYWQRIARQIEEGTFRRDVVRAQQRRQQGRAKPQERAAENEGPSAWELDVDVELDEPVPTGVSSAGVSSAGVSSAGVSSASMSAGSSRGATSFDDSDVDAILGSLGPRPSEPVPARRVLSPFAFGRPPGTGAAPPSPMPGAGVPGPGAPAAGAPTPAKPVTTFGKPGSATSPRSPGPTVPVTPPAAVTPPRPAAPVAAPAPPARPLAAPVHAPAAAAAPPPPRPAAAAAAPPPPRPAAAAAAPPPPRPAAAAAAPPPPRPAAAAAPPPPRPAASPRPEGPPTPARPAQPPAPDDARLRTIYESYVDARRRNNERVDNVKFETVAHSVQQLIPKLREKHGNRPIDFEVVVQNGKVGLKPKVGG